MDPIADMLSQIKNAAMQNKQSVAVPYSKLKSAIADTLAERGYIASASEASEGSKRQLVMELAYKDGKTPAITDTRRISKISLRVYNKASDIQSVKYGHGDVVLSTPSGVMTGDQAKQSNVGGEVLFEIW